jgi:hypothetical protein
MAANLRRPPELAPFSGSFAGIRIKPLYNLLDAIRLGSQPRSSSIDRFCLVFQLRQASGSSEEQAGFIWMRTRVWYLGSDFADQLFNGQLCRPVACRTCKCVGRQTMDRWLRSGDSELPSLVHGQGNAACSRPVQQPNDCRPSLYRSVGNQHLALRAQIPTHQHPSIARNPRRSPAACCGFCLFTKPSHDGAWRGGNPSRSHPKK